MLSSPPQIIPMAAFEKSDDEMSWQHCGTEDFRHSLEGKATTTQSHLASSSYYLNRAPQFPEGCPKGYLTVFGAFMALFCTFGQMNAFGTFQTWYAEHQLSHLEPSTIAWIGSLQLWVFFFSGGPIGQLFDAYGPRWIMAIGSIIYVFSIMMTSISTQYYQYLLAHGVLFGLGVGMLFYPSLSSVSTYFSKYRATALGVVASGSSFGGVMYPIMLQRLFQLVGFGWGVRISGLISGAVCCVAVFTVTRYAPPKQRGATCRLLETLTDSRFVLLATGSSFVALGLFIPFFFIVDYARDLMIPARMTFIVLAVMNAGGVVGRIAPAYLSDKLGRFNLLAPRSLPVRTPLLPLMLFAATYGFTSGAFISVITPCVAQISDIRQIGSRIGILYSIISFPALVGGPAAGALLEADKGQYTGLILFAGLTVIAGSVLILAAKLRIDSRLFARV
ncbi:Monocarboxylate permease-like protein [Mycena sanguinolenta]|uniref:Monocarboxylate permease-like protein n=1 Tax=Mycena sanguinolenta TaxID=230812 RepID=A0A8H6XLL1_9AGAR|nr:Monocarboxylate permease-like protein [Mycena sanguinolenta]